MKKLVSIFMVTAFIFLCAGFTANAEVTEVSVPKIEINTENSNGTALQKADGYVNAEIKITDTDNSVLGGSVLFKVRGNSTAMAGIAKKSFTFKFDKKNSVLGMGKGKKWALLANCFDPTLLTPPLILRVRWAYLTPPNRGLPNYGLTENTEAVTRFMSPFRKARIA